MRIIEVCINIEKSGLLASKALRAIASQRRSLDSRGQKSRGAASVVPLGSAVGRTVSPAKSRADALAPGPQKATLFGEGGAEEVAREAGMSHTGAGWPLSRRDGCFVEEGTWTQRTGCEAWGGAATGHNTTRGWGEAGSGSVPSAGRGAWSCPHLRGEPAAPTTVGQGFLTFTPLGQRFPVTTTAPGN